MCKKIFVLTILIVNIFTLSLASRVHAQQFYTLDINEGDEFTWTITELNPHQFKKVFGFEPAFEVGDQSKKKVIDILPTSFGWSLVLEEWDFDLEFQGNGTSKSLVVYNSPEEYDEHIFIPTPAIDYLAEAEKTLPSKYIVEGLRVTRRESNYRMIKEYNYKGVCTLEQYIDDDGIVLIKVEGNTIIPFGNYFIGFLGLAVLGIIIVMLKKRLFVIQRTS